jgi:multidrug efflux system outer membrane protein
MPPIPTRRFSCSPAKVYGLLLALFFLAPFDGLSSLASEVKPEIKNAGINTLQGKLEWSSAKPNPENPSDLRITHEVVDRQWWEQFNDAILTGYINQALAQNHQLAITKARITEARANTQTAISNMFPTINFAPSFLRQKTSANQFPNFGTGGGGGIGLGSFALKPYSIMATPLQASYEADFFLKNFDKVRAARRQAQASLQDYRTASIALVTDVSSTYFNLISVDKQIELQREVIALSEADLAAERLRLDEGLVSQEKVAIKQGILTDSKAALQDYFRLQAVYTHQMATLLGRSTEVTEQLPRQSFDRFSLPTVLNAGIPSQLIARRPDILSAESLLEAARINVVVARKEFLPTFNITGTFGLASTSLDKFLKRSSKTWSYGANMKQGIFRGGANIANLKLSKAQYQEQLHQYQQTILTSLQEVNDALASAKAHCNAFEQYQSGNTSLQQQLGYQQAQLDEGLVATSDLYPTRIQLIQSHQGLVQAKLLALTDSVNLYKALGGGY